MQRIMMSIILPLFLLLCAATSSPARAGQAEIEGRILSAINHIRAEHGLPRLSASRNLNKLARAHSREMAGSGALSHRDRAGRDLAARFEAAGVRGWRIIGENVGRSFGDRDNAGTIVSGWMESRPHRENILTPVFNRTAIGVASSSDGTLYATQIFMGTGDSEP